LELNEKTNNPIIGKDNTKIATAESLCKIEDSPGKGKAILNKFKYLGGIHLRIILYCKIYLISALLSFFS
jgi:hypothetical protein